MTAEPVRTRLHALAERLGYTVRELGARMTMGEMRDWIAYDSLRNPQKPTEGSRDDMRDQMHVVKRGR